MQKSHQFRSLGLSIPISLLEELLYRETESYVSHHKTSKHQCTRFKQAALFLRDKSFHIKFENRRRDVISLNKPRGMSAKMAANGSHF